MLKIRKLKGGQEFRVSQYAEAYEGNEILVWQHRITRDEFKDFLKDQIKRNQIQRKHWIDCARLYIRYSDVPVCFNEAGEHVSGILYGGNA